MRTRKRREEGRKRGERGGTDQLAEHANEFEPFVDLELVSVVQKRIQVAEVLSKPVEVCTDERMVMMVMIEW
jgi:hypothetical protein